MKFYIHSQNHLTKFLPSTINTSIYGLIAYFNDDIFTRELRSNTSTYTEYASLTPYLWVLKADRVFIGGRGWVAKQVEYRSNITVASYEDVSKRIDNLVMSDLLKLVDKIETEHNNNIKNILLNRINL